MTTTAEQIVACRSFVKSKRRCPCMFATSELKKLQKLIRDIVSGWDDESKFVEFIKWREILSTVSLILKEREYEQDAFELQEYVRRD